MNIGRSRSKNKGKRKRKQLDAFHAYLKAREAARRKKKRKRSGEYANTDPANKWLRESTSRLMYGEKIEQDILPQLSKDVFLKQYNARRYGASLNNTQYADHRAGLRTYYYWADHRSSTPNILVTVDIDAKNGEKGAVAFAERIKQEKTLAGMYYEASQGGNGVNGYLRIQKRGFNALEVKKILKNLDDYLKRLALVTKADISGVEIKGLPPVPEYDEKGNMSYITYGVFARLPRKPELAMHTCTVDIRTLALLEPDSICTKPAAVKMAATRKMAGSYSTKVVTDDILANL